jgi:hypothetical protein
MNVHQLFKQALNNVYGNTGLFPIANHCENR